MIRDRNLKDRINKNKLLEGHRLATDKKQFQVELDEPDVLLIPINVEFLDRLEVCLGHHTFLIVFGHGQQKILCGLDNPNSKSLLAVTSSNGRRPNRANPFKMQRFALENAKALERWPRWARKSYARVTGR